MKLLLCSRGSVSERDWLDGLRAALPGHVVAIWRPGLAADFDVALVWDPPQRLFDEQHALKMIFNLGAGVEKLLALRLPAGIPVLRLEDAGMALQMAEYACHAVIGFFREFGVYRCQQARALWRPHAARDRGDFPVGIMGLGALGARVAAAVRQFGFPMTGWSRSRHVLEGVRTYAGPGELDEFLAATRVLVVLLPLTAATRGILDGERLRHLRGGGCLVNLARGGLVVEDDLRDALDTGQLGAAVLDVVATEPLPADHWMWRHPRVTLTPHISAQTLCADAVVQVAHAVEALERGAPLPGQIDRLRGY